nr:hypothetical protein [Vibrio sp. SS-MA-C1-2]
MTRRLQNTLLATLQPQANDKIIIVIVSNKIEQPLSRLKTYQA